MTRSTYTAVLLSTALTAAVSAQEASFVRITDEDTPIRGFGVAPALHAGQVALLGTEMATGTDGIFMLPADGSDGYVVIVYRGDPIPNNPGREFGLPGNPDIHDGVVAFQGGWQTSHDGVYLGSGGPLTVFLDSTVEGGEPPVAFPDLDVEGVGFESNGFLEPPFFKAFGGEVISLSPDPPPGGGTSFASWELPYLGPSLGGGHASFAAIVNHAGGADRGVYVHDLTTHELEVVANWETVIPGRTETFESFNYTDTDGQRVVFEGAHGNLFFDGFAGVYLAPLGADGAGPFTVIAEHDQPTPDGDGTFWSFNDVAVDGELVVFTAILAGDEGEPANGLYGWRKGTLFTIVDEADELFGEDLIDFNITNRSLDGNQVVFRARFVDPDAPFDQGVAVYVATIAFPIEGDLDGDGDVDSQDLLEMLAQWGPCEPDCTADLDGDMTVGVTDLLMLLSNWS